MGIGGMLLAIVLALAPPAGAAEIFRHSGAIVDISDDVPTFVLAEVGPWQTRGGATVVTHRTIAWTAETQFTVVGRGDRPASGFPGDFVELRVGPQEVYLNDYVTIECVHQGSRLIARKIIVVEPEP